MKEHEDILDRNLLTNVPVVSESENDKAKIYRFQQFLHMIRNFSEIIQSEGGEKK